MLVRFGLGLLLVANLVAASFAFNLFGSSPEALNAALNSANNQLHADQARLARSRVLAGSVGKGKSEGDTFLASYFTNRRHTYSTILGEIRETATMAGMKTQEGTFALDPIEGSGDLSIMTISVNFEGTFPQLVKFVNLLDRSPRFLIIESMQVAPQPKGDILNTNLKLHVFVKDDTGGGQ
ncbi:MAG TPA: GspMb/PilO family protein [Bryobacteraceae bacterium]|nr:GspMb/PilO family protein [Bryobacteraceae bacterium]